MPAPGLAFGQPEREPCAARIQVLLPLGAKTWMAGASPTMMRSQRGGAENRNETYPATLSAGLSVSAGITSRAKRRRLSRARSPPPEPPPLSST